MELIRNAGTAGSQKFNIKRFGDSTVLDDISVTVRKGEVVVILGPSGCGKSTLLRCINALEDIQGGEILIDGENILTGGKHNPKVGMVFQSYDLFPHLNVLDNITLAPVKVQKGKKKEKEIYTIEEMQHLFQLLETAPLVYRR